VGLLRGGEAGWDFVFGGWGLRGILFRDLFIGWRVVEREV